MDSRNATQQTIREVVKKFLPFVAGLLYLILLAVAAISFYRSDLLLFGPEQIVGVLNVGYHADGGFYYTNPLAMLFRYLVYLLILGALTWFAAVGCEPFLRLHLSPRFAEFSGKLRRLLSACVFCGIFIGIGTGILVWASRQDAELWRNVNTCHSVAQYEKCFGKARYHTPKADEEFFEQFVQNRRMCEREFALGKEVYVFQSRWPFRRFFVWLENGRIVRMTWRGGW